MRKVDSLYVGWVDSSIGALVRQASGILPRSAFVLLTSIDSTIELRDSGIAEKIFRTNHASTTLGNGLVVPGPSLQAIATMFNLFTGFDELWCFDEQPTMPKPDAVWLVSPLELNSDDVPSSLGPWMRDSGCKLGLGDGVGLNYASPTAAAAQLIEELTSSDERPHR